MSEQPQCLRDVVRRVTGRPHAEIATWSRTPLAHRVENLTTNALDRYEGVLDDGTAWSVVAKTLHPASESPTFASIPPDKHADTLVALNWLDEPARYRSTIGSALPGPLRMPHIHAIDESSSRITIWMEDVPDTTEWDLDRYRRTAVALGRLGGHWHGGRPMETFGLPHREIAGLFFGKISHVDLPMQRDDDFWRHPVIDAVVGPEFRASLFGLAEEVPAMLARLDDLPRSVCHGDATPDNFLEPGDGSIVGIDWAFANVDALGSDLAQLLSGRFESGAAGAGDVEPIASVVRDGYLEGLAAEDAAVSPGDVEHAWATHLAIRSVFSALTLERRSDLDDDSYVELLGRRAALARFGLDFCRHLSPR